MLAKIELFRVRDDIDEKCDLSNLNFDFVRHAFPNLKKELKTYYLIIYDFDQDYNDSKSSVDKYYILDKIENQFKLNPPSDFKGKLQYSDIVKINDDQVFFYDSHGWFELE